MTPSDRIELADEAERLIAESFAKVAASEGPSFDLYAGEINLAFKLKLIDYPRRDVLLGQLRAIVNNRREVLKAQHIARLLGE